jgi:hypothetical protein
MAKEVIRPDESYICSLSAHRCSHPRIENKGIPSLCSTGSVTSRHSTLVNSACYYQDTRFLSRLTLSLAPIVCACQLVPVFAGTTLFIGQARYQCRIASMHGSKVRPKGIFIVQSIWAKVDVFSVQLTNGVTSGGSRYS